MPMSRFGITMPVSWKGRPFRLAATLALAACSHSEPFGTDAPDPLGPADLGLPRQLTYNLGDDRAPNVAGAQVVFSRYDPSNVAPGQCIALLPAEGGTLSATLCPPAPTVADTFVSSWLEPALWPDDGRLAFVWRRSARVSALAAWQYDLVVASVDSPSVPLASRLVARVLPGDRFANTAVEVAWIGPEVVRFLAAYDSVVKVKGGGASRFTDTITVSRALMELNLSTGALDVVPGGDSARAWTPAAAGTFVVTDADPSLVVLLGADGSRTPVGTFPQPVTDLAAVGSRLVATVGLELLFWIDPGTGQAGAVGLAGIAHRLAAAGADRVVVEVERPRDVFGGPANLWLVPIPTGGAQTP
jgi:hypothetical protein